MYVFIYCNLCFVLLIFVLSCYSMRIASTEVLDVPNELNGIDIPVNKPRGIINYYILKSTRSTKQFSEY